VTRLLTKRARFASAVLLATLVGAHATELAAVDTPLPELTQPVNDFANVIDQQSRAELERLSRAL